MRLALQKIESLPPSEDKDEILEIWAEIQLFFWNLTVSPKYWVMMFEAEQFYSDENESIDMNVFTSKIYKRVLK